MTLIDEYEKQPGDLEEKPRDKPKKKEQKEKSGCRGCSHEEENLVELAHPKLAQTIRMPTGSVQSWEKQGWRVKK